MNINPCSYDYGNHKYIEELYIFTTLFKIYLTSIFYCSRGNGKQIMKEAIYKMVVIKVPVLKNDICFSNSWHLLLMVIAILRMESYYT